MVGLVRNRNRLGTVQDLEAYLFSAVRRDLWRALKQERKEMAILVPFDRERDSDAKSLQTIGSQSATECVDNRDFLMVALASLTSDQRAIIELRFFGELTFGRYGLGPVGCTNASFVSTSSEFEIRQGCGSIDLECNAVRAAPR